MGTASEEPDPSRFGRPRPGRRENIVMSRIGLLALLVSSALIPGVAVARGYRGGGRIYTPFGSANMNSPEWRQSGGNIMVYQQIMMQKQMLLQQRAMMRQQQEFLRQQKMQEKYLKQQMKEDDLRSSRPVAEHPAVAKKRKKRPTLKANPASASATKAPKAEEASRTTKP